MALFLNYEGPSRAIRTYLPPTLRQHNELRIAIAVFAFLEILLFHKYVIDVYLIMGLLTFNGLILKSIFPRYRGEVLLSEIEMQKAHI